MNHTAPFKHLHILFADDDPCFSSTTCKLLEMLFGRVFYVPSGKEALQLFEQELIHIVMLDVRLGDISGLEVARTIRLTNRTIPLFLVSSYAEQQDLLEACRYHLVEYLTKPFSFDVLMQTLNRCLSDIEKDNALSAELSDSLCYNFTQKSLFHQGTIVPLVRSERIVLEILLHHKGRVVPYRTFHERLGYDNSKASLKNIILRLRNKIGKNLIENLSKEGYKLL